MSEVKFEEELLIRKMSGTPQEQLREYTNSFINDKLKIIEGLSPELLQINEIIKLFYYDPGCFYLYFLIGSIYEKMIIEKFDINYLQFAKSYYTQCIYHNSEFSDAYLKLALIFKLEDDNKLSKNYKNCLSILETASKKFPKDHRIKNSLGVIYIESGQYKKASDTMTSIINDTNVDIGIKIDVLHNTGTFTLDNYKAIKYLNESEKLLFENKCNYKETSFINLSTLQNKLLRLNRVYIKDIVSITSPLDELDYIYRQHQKINFVFKDIIKNETKKTYKVKNIINIGYVSSDFKNHVITKYMYGPIKHHNRNKFKIFLYYNGIYTGSDSEKTTLEYKKLDLTFKEIKNMSDTQAANLITDDKIDILIDLNGHTEGNRIGIFARKPAPIQITYLGYPNTTGLSTMDYRITDIYADPIDTVQKYSEKLIRMNRSFLMYDPNDVKSDLSGAFVSQGPKDLEIKIKAPNSCVIIASINKITKNSKQTIETWAKILEKLPSAKIMVKFDPDEVFMEEQYIKDLKISKSRLISLKMPAEKRKYNINYYNIFNEVDILLDPFPYTGTTTTCDSLYMGTPVITYSKKDWHVHNMSASILKHIDVPELISTSTEEYIDKCVELAQNRELLIHYKNTLRKKLLDHMSLDKFMPEYEKILENLAV